MKTHNELIAEFMGFKFHSDRESGNIRIYDVPEGKDLEYKAFKLSHLKFQFDTSWDWLMPVVEKIEKSVRISIYKGHTCLELHELSSDESFPSFSGPKLEATYKAVVTYIKFYNDSLT